jgi:hypothetical protein
MPTIIVPLGGFRGVGLSCLKKRAKLENNTKFQKPILTGKQVRTEADHLLLLSMLSQFYILRIGGVSALF